MKHLQLILLFSSIFWMRAESESKLFESLTKQYHSFINYLVKDGQDDPSFKHYYKAYQLVLDENWSASIKAFKELINKFPKSKYIDDAYYWVAYANQEDGKSEVAAKAYLKFMEGFKDSNLFDDAERNLKKLSKILVQKGLTKYKKYMDDDEDDLDYSSKKLKMEAIFAIYNTGTKKAQQKLKSIALGKKYSSKLREKALFWYGQSDRVSVKDLREIFDSAETDRMKEKVIFAISQKTGKESVDALVHMFKNVSVKSRLREKAMFWIFQNRENYYSSHLQELIDFTKDDLHLRKKLMFNISQSSLDNRSQLLYNFAVSDNEDTSVREKAIFWLGQSDKGGFEMLKRIYSQTSDERLKEKLIFSFSQFETNESIDFMIKLLKLKSTSVHVKKKIIFWLGQSNSKKAKDAILELID